MDTAERPLFANAMAAADPVAPELLPAPLEREVREIYRLSPFYARRFPIHEDRLHWACYREIPPLSKHDIVREGPCAFFDDCEEMNRRVDAAVYERESTSGTTAGPMTVIMEQGWWTEQTRRAYRATPLLREFADRPHRKAVLAPVNCSSHLCPYEDFPFPHRWIDNTIYLNLSSDPFAFLEPEWDRIAAELQAVKPEVVEGEPVYLSLLARALRKREVTLPSVRAVILTYGKASRVHGRRVAEAFPGARLVDLYGSTEAGYLFVGPAFESVRPIDENAFLELEPHGRERGLRDVFHLVVTTRRRQAMPLLRYRSGDLVQSVGDGAYRVLGREKDLSFRADGRLLTVFDIDAALPDDWRVWHYCLTQIGERRWEFAYVADRTMPDGLEETLAEAIGGGVRLQGRRRRLIAPAASGKFALFKPLGTGSGR